MLNARRCGVCVCARACVCVVKWVGGVGAVNRAKVRTIEWFKGFMFKWSGE